MPRGITKLLLVAILSQVLFFHGAFGQINQAKPKKISENVGKKSQKFTLGLRFGPSLTIGHFPKNLPDTVLNTHKNRVKPGFSVAGQLNFPVQQKDYWCMIELGYARAGRKVDYNIKTNQDKWQNNFTYSYLTSSLALRRAFQFHLREDLVADWYLSVGPNISYMMGAKGKITIFYPPQPDPWNSPATDHSTPFDIKFHNLSDSGWYKKNYNEIGVYHFNNANRFFFGVDLGIGGYAPITNRQKIYTEFRVTLGQTFIRKRDTKAILGGVIGGVTDPANPIPKPSGPGIFSDPLTTNMKTFTLSVIYTLDFDKNASRKGKSTMDKKRKKSARKR
jgi:hypothetical protein